MEGKVKIHKISNKKRIIIIMLFCVLAAAVTIAILVSGMGASEELRGVLV